MLSKPHSRACARALLGFTATLLVTCSMSCASRNTTASLEAEHPSARVWSGGNDLEIPSPGERALPADDCVQIDPDELARARPLRLANPNHAAAPDGILDLAIAYDRSDVAAAIEPVRLIRWSAIDLTANPPQPAASTYGEPVPHVEILSQDRPARLGEIRDFRVAGSVVWFSTRVRVGRDTRAVRVLEGRRVLYELSRPERSPDVEARMLEHRSRSFVVRARGHTIPIKVGFIDAFGVEELTKTIPKPAESEESCWVLVEPTSQPTQSRSSAPQLLLRDMFWRWTFQLEDRATE